MYMARRIVLLLVTALTDGGRARVMWGAPQSSLLWPRFFFVNVVLFTSAVHHARTQPFKVALANRLEGACLFCLTALFNGEVAVYGVGASGALRSALSVAMSVAEVAVLLVLAASALAPTFLVRDEAVRKVRKASLASMEGDDDEDDEETLRLRQELKELRREAARRGLDPDST